jgi:TolB protein
MIDRQAISTLLLTTIIIGLVACTSEEDQVQVDREPPDLIFVRHTEDDSDIYGLRLSDMSTTQLTQTAADEEFPVWSPDGSRFAYLSLSDDAVEVKIQTLNAKEEAVSLSSIDQPVSWSGDSDALVTTREDDVTRGLVVVSVLDGRETKVPTGADGDAYATWSPAKDVIAFESTRDGNPEIYSAGTDGSDVQRLTDNEILDEWPQWSHSGEYIAYGSGVEGDKDLWVMRSDGTEKRQLTSDILFGDAYPSWSPDDSQLVFTVLDSEERPLLMIIDVASTALEPLVAGSAASWRPIQTEGVQP